jgi:hypothetical protein
MSVGPPVTKADLDNTLNREIGAVWTALEAVNKRNSWLNHSSHTDALLLTPLGYGGPGAGTDINILRGAFTDLASLWNLSHGVTGALGVAAVGSTAALNNFFFNATLLQGLSWYG